MLDHSKSTKTKISVAHVFHPSLIAGRELGRSIAKPNYTSDFSNRSISARFAF